MFCITGPYAWNTCVNRHLSSPIYSSTDGNGAGCPAPTKVNCPSAKHIGKLGNNLNHCVSMRPGTNRMARAFRKFLSSRNGNINSCVSRVEGVKCIQGRTRISLLLELMVAYGKDKEEYVANTCFAGT